MWWSFKMSWKLGVTFLLLPWLTGAWVRWGCNCVSSSHPAQQPLHLPCALVLPPDHHKSFFFPSHCLAVAFLALQSLHEAAAQRHQCCTLLMLTCISWWSHCPEQGSVQRKVRYQCPGRVRSPALSWQPCWSPAPCSWGHRAARGLPQAGRGTCTASTQRLYTEQEQSLAEQQSCFLFVLLFAACFLNKSNQSRTSKCISLEMETSVLLIPPGLHKPALSSPLSL